MKTMTTYYFRTFVVGKHHSQRALREELIELQKDADPALTEMIQSALKDMPLVVEGNEHEYWINELARRAALEINSYGRVKPETLELMMCMQDDDFSAIMAIADSITQHIQELCKNAVNTPLPTNIPVVL